MFIAVKIILLASLVTLLMASDSPMLCAGLYVGAVAIFGLIMDISAINLLFLCPLSFLLALAYFWLLSRYEKSDWWWFILICGLAVGLV